MKRPDFDYKKYKEKYGEELADFADNLYYNIDWDEVDEDTMTDDICRYTHCWLESDETRIIKHDYSNPIIDFVDDFVDTLELQEDDDDEENAVSPAYTIERSWE